MTGVLVFGISVIAIVLALTYATVVCFVAVVILLFYIVF